MELTANLTELVDHHNPVFVKLSTSHMEAAGVCVYSAWSSGASICINEVHPIMERVWLPSSPFILRRRSVPSTRMSKGKEAVCSRARNLPRRVSGRACGNIVPKRCRWTQSRASWAQPARGSNGHYRYPSAGGLYGVRLWAVNPAARLVLAPQIDGTYVHAPISLGRERIDDAFLGQLQGSVWEARSTTTPARRWSLIPTISWPSFIAFSSVDWPMPDWTRGRARIVRCPNEIVDRKTSIVGAGSPVIQGSRTSGARRRRYLNSFSVEH
ncbi:hypothetical protein [Burkholderia ubonensis]|uniref:hypothetical protein n=1 Tax=Burkholderia ubonensis TaxID=101571 RepID=UPI001581BE73|nr:hypothetical protein [Burkholderia ubonensis]